MSLQMRSIKKSFAGNVVLADVNLDVEPGKVHALVGENGAGKSTLMKILAGVHLPDHGEILIDGTSVTFHSPADSLEHGIAMIYQELSLAPHLSVAENILLGSEPLSVPLLKIINRRELVRRARALLAENDFHIDPGKLVEYLSAANRQLVEITRATAEARRIIVMDEPTSSLTTQEVRNLFRLIERLKSRGLAIIYISHRLEELEHIADSLTILRDGRVVHSGSWGSLSTSEIIRHMAGRELKEIFPAREVEAGPVRLRVHQLSRLDKFSEVTFSIRAGEVVGLAGLAGSGRTELVEAIFGVTPPDEGEIYLDETRFDSVRPSVAVKHGVGLLTEDRKRTGLGLNLSVTHNLTLANVRALLRGWMLDRGRELNIARKFINKLRINPPQPNKIVALLSGGNQQKVLLARWLFADSKIFLLDEPTRGVDVSARAEIYQVINNLVEAGAAVLMVSSDLPELLGMADRILVMRRGHLVAELNAKLTTQEEVLQHAAVVDKAA